MSSSFPAADCSTLTDPATEKLRGPKPAVLVRGTTRSPIVVGSGGSGSVCSVYSAVVMTEPLQEFTLLMC